MPSALNARCRVRAFIIAVLILILTPVSPGLGAPIERIGGVPVESDTTLSAAVPDVAMPAGVLRTSDGRTLWERDPDAERAMASTTKIMTALVVLDAADLDEMVTVSAQAAAVGESEAGLVAGESYTVERLLEAMLVHSGNDAAFALAEHVGGDINGFVALMNAKAASIGLTHTAYTNPHGLDEPSRHVVGDTGDGDRHQGRGLVPALRHPLRQVADTGARSTCGWPG